MIVREGQRLPGLSGNAILARRYLARQNFVQFADVSTLRCSGRPKGPMVCAFTYCRAESVHLQTYVHSLLKVHYFHPGVMVAHTPHPRSSAALCCIYDFQASRACQLAC